MTQFVKVGKLWLSAAEVRAVQQDHEGGPVLLHYGNRCEEVSADDGKALVEWAESNLIIPAQKARPKHKDEKK